MHENFFLIQTEIFTIEFSHSFMICGNEFTFKALDYIGVVIIVILVLMHLSTVRKDIKDYAEMDPMPKRD